MKVRALENFLVSLMVNTLPEFSGKFDGKHFT